MKLIRLALLAGSALGTFCLPAWAADFYGKAPEFAPQPPPADWSGLSVFGAIGYGWVTGNTQFNGTDNIPGGNGQFITFANTIGLPLSFNLNDGAIQGGGGVAFDRQFGQWIFGITTSWTFMGTGASNGATASFDNIGDMLGINTQTSLHWYGSTQGEIGFQPRRDIPLAGFVHAGVAYGDVSHTDTVFATGPFINAVGGPFATHLDTSTTLFGPVVGARVEYMITRQWIAAVDYEHVFWGSLDTNVPFLNGTAGQARTDLSLDSVRLNVKYLLPLWQ